MNKLILFVAILLTTSNIFSQTVDLKRIGQTTFSSSSVVDWDSTSQKLIAGVGSILKVYDFSDTGNPMVVAQRPFVGFINETELVGNVLFVAATHDGVYALDYTSDTLAILAQYNMHNQGAKAAYDICLSNDTVFVADNNRIRMLRFTGTSFDDLGYFGPFNSFAVAKRGDLIAVGNHGLIGTISIYNIHNLAAPVATWSSPNIWYLMDVQFADLRNDIVYVCGGPQNLAIVSSVFYALQINGSNLSMVDSLNVGGGFPGLAQVNIINMASHNDTLFLATTAAPDYSALPLTYLPILDATGLPADTMKEIGKVNGGLWHFDASVMTGTPYIAIASEWAGILISDISQLHPFDTLGLINTGGWCTNNKVINDTLWGCHEGNGLFAYAIDSLLFPTGLSNQSSLLHINTQFVTDFEILNDSLLILNTGEVFNLRNWQLGGQVEAVDNIPHSWLLLDVAKTNIGSRIVGSSDNLLGYQSVQIVNPFDSINNYPIVDEIELQNSANSLVVVGDTAYFGQKIDSLFYLVATKIENDQFVFIDTIQMPGEILSVDIERNTIAVSCKTTILWISWSSGQLQTDGSFFNIFLNAQDVALKNSYIYVADKFHGLQIFDISQGIVAGASADFVGSEGWLNVFGSSSISVGNDGKIFLSDFQAGVIIVEPFDSTLNTGIEMPEWGSSSEITVFPNPANEKATFVIENQTSSNLIFRLTDIEGKTIVLMNKPNCNSFTINTNQIPDGMYLYSTTTEDGITKSGKLIIAH